MSKLSVLVVQEEIPHYRIPIFRCFAEHVDLTVAACSCPSGAGFKTKKLNRTQIGPLTYLHGLASQYLDTFDVVIFGFNLRWINLAHQLRRKARRYRLLLWGIGVGSENGYDSNRHLWALRTQYARTADATILYSNAPVEGYANAGVPADSLHVASNTLAGLGVARERTAEHFVFVGSIKRYKRFEDVLRLYRSARERARHFPPLVVIGGGDGLGRMQGIANDMGIEDKVSFRGAITESSQLEQLYAGAIASVSPFQAGLSVLQAFSAGVPFVTLASSVTGGERFHIQHNETGILAHSEDEFVEHLVTLAEDRGRALRMGASARAYFLENCSVDRMVGGFTAAIEYACRRHSQP